MKKSKNVQVQKFLEDLQAIDPEKFILIAQLRADTLKTFPKIVEVIKYGGIVFFKDEQLVGGLFVSKKHLSYEFSNGNKMKDPNKLLEGTGKYRRHLKFNTMADINAKQAMQFIEQL